jgi:integrase
VACNIRLHSRPISADWKPTAILIAYRHGLRSSELVALRWDDIDFAPGKLHVRRSKGGQASVHPIGGRDMGSAFS